MHNITVHDSDSTLNDNHMLQEQDKRIKAAYVSPKISLVTSFHKITQGGGSDYPQESQGTYGS